MSRISARPRRRAVARAIVIASLIASTVIAPWTAAQVMATAASPATTITIDGHGRGAAFDGVGSISGGGGLTRLLIDYPPMQRSQILDYLFGPGGADLQILKLEIGGDAAQSDGAEPSVEHTRGHIDCRSGYGWWLAEQAVERNPKITLMALQWSAPGWIGTSIWDHADIGYVIAWLNCARSHGLTISYMGGWNEHGYVKSWYEGLRSALNAHGYRSVKIIAADSFPGGHYLPARTWKVAAAAAADPKFKRALGAIGSHDTCGGPTTGYVCESTAVARHLGLPLWESELGTLHGATSAANMARTINNGFIQADINGFLQWPITAAMSPGLLYSDRGIVIADQPQSGHYVVNQIAWAIAQTTQFTSPGWRHVPGASGTIGGSGNYVAYDSPDRRDWSLVAENTGDHLGQHVSPQQITVHLTGGLKTTDISVWSTNLQSTDPATWFVHRSDVHVFAGSFSYTLQPGYIVSFTSTTGQSHLRTKSPATVPLRLPYTAVPDASNEAWGLDTQEGAFLYTKCRGRAKGSCIEQMAPREPIFWETPLFGTPTPYALVGDPRWSNYTVSARVLLGRRTARVGLITRFSHQGNDPKHFEGYEFDLWGDGFWRLTLNADKSVAEVLAHGRVRRFRFGIWHTLAFRSNRIRLVAILDGRILVRHLDRTYRFGLAGIASNWTLVQFRNVSVR
jgi:O-glycosyl hydrolase